MEERDEEQLVLWVDQWSETVGVNILHGQEEKKTRLGRLAVI